MMMMPGPTVGVYVYEAVQGCIQTFYSPPHPQDEEGYKMYINGTFYSQLMQINYSNISIIIIINNNNIKMFESAHKRPCIAKHIILFYQP